jgi:hypothetical protein
VKFRIQEAFRRQEKYLWRDVDRPPYPVCIKLRKLPINVHDQDLNLVTPEDRNYVYTLNGLKQNFF